MLDNQNHFFYMIIALIGLTCLSRRVMDLSQKHLPCWATLRPLRAASSTAWKSSQRRL